MCGVVGLALGTGGAGDVDRREVVGRMMDLVAHRGPDSSGYWEDEHVSLGFRRLAILDLSPAGSQPMESADGSVVIAFNGEIYDFATHRRALEAKGHTFRSRSDTEVLLALYLEHGTAFVERVDGMFAFALWDRRRRMLVLGRDRFGQKPLYHARLADGGIGFASELPAIRALPGVDFGVDVESLDELLTLGFVPAPHTIHAGVRSLPGGHLLLRREGREESVRIDYGPPPVRRARRFEDAVAEGREVLRKAVQSTLVSDVPVGLFLSGGIDSSLVAASLEAPIRAFTVTFRGADTDELPHARAVADKLGLELDAVEVEPTSFADPSSLVAMFGEPFADVAALPTAILAKAARDAGIVVALTGDGGDEVFGGYPHHAVAFQLSRLTPFLRAPLVGPALRGAARRIARALREGDGVRTPSRTLKRLLEMLAIAEPLAATRVLRGSISGDLRTRLLRPEVAARLAGRDPWRAFGGDLGLDGIFSADGDAVLADRFLRKSDVATMRASLESRAPFLDRGLVAFARSLPISHLVSGGRGKRLLRAILRSHIGALADRPKMGFSPPVAAWLRGPLRRMVDEVLRRGQARYAEWFDPACVGQLLDEHVSRTADHHRPLWTLLLLEIWLGALDGTAPINARPPAPIPTGPRALS